MNVDLDTFPNIEGISPRNKAFLVRAWRTKFNNRFIQFRTTELVVEMQQILKMVSEKYFATVDEDERINLRNILISGVNTAFTNWLSKWVDLPVDHGLNVELEIDENAIHVNLNDVLKDLNDPATSVKFDAITGYPTAIRAFQRYAEEELAAGRLPVAQ